jgi:hypothetical protein
MNLADAARTNMDVGPVFNLAIADEPRCKAWDGALTAAAGCRAEACHGARVAEMLEFTAAWCRGKAWEVGCKLIVGIQAGSTAGAVFGRCHVRMRLGQKANSTALIMFEAKAEVFSLAASLACLC